MAVEAIWLTSPKQLSFNKEAMKNMTRLRIFHICYEYGYRQGSSLPDDSNCPIEYFSNNLCWFVWRYYPWKSLPEKFKPQKLVHLDLRWSSLHHLWNETKFLPCLKTLDLSESKRLIETPDFTEMPNLEYLYLYACTSLQEVHPSLRCCRKLKMLVLDGCESLVRFSYVNVESLQYLYLRNCSSLEKFPEILGIMKPELEIQMHDSGIKELPSSLFQHQTHLTELDFQKFFGYYEGWQSLKLVSLPSSICMLKDLVKLDVSKCKKIETLPEEMGDLENLKYLYAKNTLILQPPSSIVRLNKLKVLDFSKDDNSANFVFPRLNGGLRSLEILNLSGCNLIDGGLPEDIGCLSSLKELHLRENNFEHLPRSIAQLGALRSLYLSDCKRLKELPEFPQQLDTIDADWSNDWICNSLFQNISSLQHDISASDSLSLRVFSSWAEEEIPSWFHLRGSGTSVSFNLPENWYISDNFVGFAVCYYGRLIDITAHLIPLCDDGMSLMTQKLAVSNHSEYCCLHFLLVPLSSLWDPSKANGKTPNDYGCIRFSFSGEMMMFGCRLLYKDEPENIALGQRGAETKVVKNIKVKPVAPLLRTKAISLSKIVASLSHKPGSLD